MTASAPAFKPSARARPVAWVSAFARSAVADLETAWHLVEVYRHTLGQARIQAAYSFEKDAGTPPNPYLAHLENTESVFRRSGGQAPGADRGVRLSRRSGVAEGNGERCSGCRRH